MAKNIYDHTQFFHGGGELYNSSVTKRKITPNKTFKNKVIDYYVILESTRTDEILQHTWWPKRQEDQITSQTRFMHDKEPNRTSSTMDPYHLYMG